MLTSDNDNDTLIATVLSLLPSHISIPTCESILDALAQAEGSPEAAVKALTAQVGPSKRKTDLLDHWTRKDAKRARNQAPALDKKPTAKPPSSSSKIQREPVNLMTVLRQPAPPSPKKSLAQKPPITLATPAFVAKHTPCTLHYSVLTPELACRLFYTMLNLSTGWKRNKWWLFDRIVESPHLTSFFARRTDGIDDDATWQEAAKFWYNGRPTEPPSTFPPEMEEACQVIEEIVNAEMMKRPRYPMEWGGRKPGDPLWKANVAASNCYQGTKESVGFHSDQLTYLGPYPTIASLSLGTTRNFTLREVVPSSEKETRKAQTFHIPLTHNSLTIMHASCQERFKHSVPPQPVIDLYRPAFPREGEDVVEPSNCRINITFRFYRPDFRPPSVPLCNCGVPTILRPDMKNRQDDLTDKYWWTCYAGAQNDGKGCNFWKVLDMEEEGRGPCVGPSLETKRASR